MKINLVSFFYGFALFSALVNITCSSAMQQYQESMQIENQQSSITLPTLPDDIKEFLFETLIRMAETASEAVTNISILARLNKSFLTICVEMQRGSLSKGGLVSKLAQRFNLNTNSEILKITEMYQSINRSPLLTPLNLWIAYKKYHSAARLTNIGISA